MKNDTRAANSLYASAAPYAGLSIGAVKRVTSDAMCFGLFKISSSTVSVVHVFLRRSSEDVTRITTGRVIASVASQLKPVALKILLFKHHHKSVGWYCFTLKAKLSVTILIAVCRPRPAFVRTANVNLAPKALNRGVYVDRVLHSSTKLPRRMRRFASITAKACALESSSELCATP